MWRARSVVRAIPPFRIAEQQQSLASTLHRVCAVQRVGFLVGVVVTYLVTTAACYNPEVRDCTVRCSAATDCTGGQVCRSDGYCSMPDAKECKQGNDNTDNLVVDAAVATQADASSLCAQSCTNGSCVNGVCVIDCSVPYSCPNDVVCPANLPCRVTCGEQACGHKVNCGMSTSCEVKCNGDFSCKDEIICNSNRCDVDCIGASSCKRRTKCSNACACDVACIGAGSCAEASECPSSSCKIGNGCTSQLTGCDSC